MDTAMTVLLPLRSLRRLSATEREHATRSTWDLIRGIVAQETDLPIGRITRDLPWATLQLHPVEVAAIEAAVEDEFGLHISSKEFDACATFGDLETHIEKLLPVRSA